MNTAKSDGGHFNTSYPRKVVAVEMIFLYYPVYIE